MKFLEFSTIWETFLKLFEGMCGFWISFYLYIDISSQLSVSWVTLDWCFWLILIMSSISYSFSSYFSDSYYWFSLSYGEINAEPIAKCWWLMFGSVSQNFSYSCSSDGCNNEFTFEESNCSCIIFLFLISFTISANLWSFSSKAYCEELSYGKLISLLNFFLRVSLIFIATLLLKLGWLYVDMGYYCCCSTYS